MEAPSSGGWKLELPVFELPGNGFGNQKTSYTGSAMEQFASYMRLSDIAVRGYAMGKPDITADGRTAANGDAAQDGSARINDNIVFNDRMPCIALDKYTVIVFQEPFGAQGNRLIDAHMPADHGGFAYDHAGAVVDEKTLADLRAGMNINPGSRVGQLGDSPGNQRRA